MPVLNPDYFTDVLIECLKKDNDSRTLGKFMLSGQQEFRCAVNYFGQAKSVLIYEDSIVVIVKNGHTTHSYSISYQFSMINLIMNILASSIEEFGIACCPKDFDAIEYFLERKIKKVEVYEDLPQKYHTLIASSNFIEKVTVFLYYFSDRLRPLDMIPKRCRELKLKIANSSGIRVNKILKLSAEYIQHIEKLEIETIHHFTKRYIAPVILNHFPKLQTINVIATYEDRMKYVIEMFKDKELKFLKRLTKSKITGKMVFKNRITVSSRRVNPSFEQVLQDVQDIPNISSDPEDQTITRTTQLKENFIVEFVLSFNVDYDYYKNY